MIESLRWQLVVGLPLDAVYSHWVRVEDFPRWAEASAGWGTGLSARCYVGPAVG